MGSVCSQETVPFEPLSAEEKIKLRQEIETSQKTVSQEDDSQLQETFPNEDLENGKVNWSERIKYVQDWVETNKTQNKECDNPCENCEDRNEVTMAVIDGVVEISDDEDFLNQKKRKSDDSDVQILTEERQNVARKRQKRRRRASNFKNDIKKLKAETQDVAVGGDSAVLKNYCDSSVQTKRPKTNSSSSQTRQPFLFNASAQTSPVILHMKYTQTENCLPSTKNAFCQTSPELIEVPAVASPVKSPRTGNTYNYMSREERSLMQRPINLVNSQSIKEFIMLVALYQSIHDQYGLIMYLSKRNPKSNWDAEESNLQHTKKIVRERAAANLVKVKCSYMNFTCDEMSFFKKSLIECINDWTAKPDCHVKVKSCLDTFNWVLDFMDDVMNNTVPVESEKDSKNSVETVDQIETKNEVPQRSPIYGDLPPEVSSNSTVAPMTIIPLDSTALQNDSPEHMMKELFKVLPEQSSAPSKDAAQQDSALQNNAVQSRSTNEVSANSQVCESQLPEHRGSPSSSQALDFSHQSAGLVVQVPQTSLIQAQFAPANSSMISEYARSSSLGRSPPTQMGPNQHSAQYHNQQMQRTIIAHQQEQITHQNQQWSSGPTNYVEQYPLPVNNSRINVRTDLIMTTQPLQQSLPQPPFVQQPQQLFLQQPRQPFLQQPRQQFVQQSMQQFSPQPPQQFMTQPMQQTLSPELQRLLLQPQRPLLQLLPQPLQQQLQQVQQQLQQQWQQSLQQPLPQQLQQQMSSQVQQQVSPQVQKQVSPQVQQQLSQPTQHVQNTKLPTTQILRPPAQLNNQIPVIVNRLPVRMSDISYQRLQPGARRNSSSIEQPTSLGHNGSYQQSQSQLPPSQYGFNDAYQTHALQHQPQTAMPSTVPLQASSSHMTTSSMYQSSVAQRSQEQTTREQPLSAPRKPMPLRRMSTSQIQLPTYTESDNLEPIRQLTSQPQQRVVAVSPYQVTSRQSTTQDPPTSSEQRPPVQQNVQNMVVSLPSSQQSSTVVSTTTQSTFLVPQPPVLTSRVRRGRRMSVDSYNFKGTSTQTGAKYSHSAGIIQIANDCVAGTKKIVIQSACNAPHVQSQLWSIFMGKFHETINNHQVSSRSGQQLKIQEVNQQKQQVVVNKSVSDLHRRQNDMEERPPETLSEESVEQVSMAENEEEANTEKGQPSISPEILINMKNSMKACNICNEKSNLLCSNCLSAVYCNIGCAEQDTDHLCIKTNFILFE